MGLVFEGWLTVGIVSFKFCLELLGTFILFFEPMKILIIEDEDSLLNDIREYLAADSHLCEVARSYYEAEDKAAVNTYDMVLLDITLPGGSGMDILRLLKKLHPDTGVIIVSARDSLDDKLKGLDLGADDYITKPFHLSELNARIKAVWRRKKYKGYATLTMNEISVTPDNREAKVNDRKLELTRKEFELLMFFISNRDRVLSRESIAGHLWGDDIDMADNFDFIYTHINNLRKKIQQAGGRDYIRTIYGTGYKFTEQ